MLLGIAFGIIVYVPNCILMAAGKSNVFARFFIIEVVPYAIITYFLVRQFGTIGAAVAMTLKEMVNSLVFIRFTKRHVGLIYPFKDDAKNILLAVSVFLPTAAFALFIDNFSLWLILLLPLSLLGYLYILWNKIINAEEKAWLLIRLNKVFKLKQNNA